MLRRRRTGRQPRAQVPRQLRDHVAQQQKLAEQLRRRRPCGARPAVRANSGLTPEERLHKQGLAGAMPLG